MNKISHIPIFMKENKEIYSSKYCFQSLIWSDPGCADCIDGLGRTGLMYAVHFFQHDVLQFLLDNRADINSQAHGIFVLSIFCINSLSFIKTNCKPFVIQFIP